ncbi:hypothetical protein Tco_0438489 [Tanacetum coccineum]
MAPDTNCDRLVSWSSKKQKSTAISSTEAKYIALKKAKHVRLYVVARDEKWVPSTERVKISSTNVRLETTVTQKEETFQVIMDIIKNSMCFKAFTISVNVPKIFMQQFWYTIKKVKDSESYEFLLANKKCIVDAEVFRNILNNCPRVEGEEFTLVQDDDDTLTFLTDFGYKAGQIPPKKSRGKGSQRKKTADTHVADVDVSDKSDSEQARKRTASRRVVKKKVTISAADNIIPDPDVALESGKSISLTKATEDEATRQVHATHARIVTESDPGPAKKKTGSKSTRSVVIQDTPSAPKPKPATSKPKLKGTGGSSEGTGRIPGVPDESTVVSTTSSEETGTKLGVSDEEKVSTEENVILKWGSEQEREYSKEDLNEEEELDWIDSEEDDEKKVDTDDDKSVDLKMTDDEVLQCKEHVNDDEDEEMTNAEVKESRNGDEEDIDAAKADAEKTEESKDDSKKAKIRPTSSSLSVSLGFGDQFLKLSSDTFLIGTVKDTTDAEISLLLDIKIQFEVLHIQSPPVIQVPVSAIFEPLVLTPVQETPSAVPVTTLPPPSITTIPPAPLQQSTAPIPSPPIITDAPTITTVFPESNALSAVQLRVSKLEKDVSEIKKIDHSVKALATLKSQVPTPAPESSKIQTLTINLEHEFKKSASEILKIKKEQAEKQKMPKYTIKSTDKAALKEYYQKSALYQTMHENKSFNINFANHRLYHSLMEASIEDENAMDKGVANTVKDHKRNHDDDDDDDDYDDDDDDDNDPPAGPNQGKKTKRRRIKKSKSSKKPSTTMEIPKGKAPLKGSKTGKSASIKEPIEEPIAEVLIDNAGEDVVHDDDQPQDTSKPKITKTPNPDWFKQPPRPPTPDPEWNKRQVVLGHLGYLTIATDYFFNNDLEYLKSSDPERTYTTSITKTKADRYEIIGIKEMVLRLWSTIKHAYDKDAAKGIKHWGEWCKLWYRSQMNKFSKHNVYSTQKIIGVKSVSVKKLHVYGYLEEDVVKRADR